jgi:Peptidase family M1 domain
LNRSAPFSRIALWFALGLALCASDCAVPLAPGYRILQESREIHFVSGQNPELQIHAQFKLVNSGDSDLSFVDIVFPEEKAFGLQDLHAKIDGHEVALAKLPEESQQEMPRAQRISFDSVWRQKQGHELAIDYKFRSSADSGSRITLGTESFHLGSRGWFPLLQPPKHILAPYPKRPDKMEYSIRVPAGYVVLARGIPEKQKKENEETIFRFKLGANDLAPYVVAGRYSETGSNQKSGTAVFWTLEPLTEDSSAAAQRIAAVWTTLETDFGPLDRNIRVPHIVESAEVRSHVGRANGPAAAAFPGGLLANSDAFALGIGSDEFLEMASHALAHNWFGDQIYTTADASIGLGEGLPEYATIAIDEERNGEEGRSQRILRYFREYDAAIRVGSETTLAITTMNDPAPQRRIALAKAPLFMTALEDACGAKQMQAGVAEMVTLLRGQEVGYADLRSALERSSGKNLADLFRTWLNEKGIPADFRARYEGKTHEPDASPTRLPGTR